MSLIYCPKCKRKISSKSKKCHYCGYQITRDPNHYFDWPLFYSTTLSVIILIIVLFISHFQGIFQGIFLVIMVIVALLIIILARKIIINNENW
jgi:hypothetical protein